LAANLSASELVESVTHIPISTFKPIINVSALQGVNSMAHHHLFQLSKLHAKSTKLSAKSPCLWALVWPYNPCFIPNLSVFLVVFSHKLS
jgi:hypothetical protein